MFEIAAATPKDQGIIQRLHVLSPYPDTTVQGEATYFLARSTQGIVGAAGIELLPDGLALVRMLVVIPGYRKRKIARQLLLRLLAHGIECKAREIYAPGLFAGDYFSQFGFKYCAHADLPPAISDHPFPGVEKLTGKLMRRRLESTEETADSQVATLAKRYFDDGYFCAESVLAALADHLDIKSPLIPGIATGFCNGMSGTWGTCGSISGGVLGINLVMGRNESKAEISQNSKAVRRLIEEFHAQYGSTQCSELLACDLETPEGRKIYRDNCLRQQCRNYVGTAAAISLKVIQEAKGTEPADEKSPGTP